MSRSSFPALLAALSASCAPFLLPSGASAATFCVHQPAGCAGTAATTVQGALDAAAAAPGRDRVEVGGDLHEGFTIAAGNAVDLVGVGSTTFNLGGTDTVTIAEPSATASGLTFWVEPTSGVPIDLVAGTLQDSDVWITAMDPTIRLGDATLRRVSQPVGMDVGVGVAAVGPGGLIEDSQLISETGVVSTSSDLTIRRSLIAGSGLDSGSTGLLVAAGSTTVDDTTVDVYADRPGGTAVDVAPGAGTAALALRGVTVEGDRDAPQLTTGLRAACAGAGTATVSLLDTVAWSSGLDLEQSGSGCAVGLDHVRYGTREGAFADGPSVAAGPVGPMDVLRPGFGSSLIDAGSTRPDDGGGDVRGAPRVVDGDGDGVAVRDIGAGEYQRSAPTAALDGPATARVGEAVDFDASGSDDADGLEAPELTVAWSVDGTPVAADPESYGGRGMEHAFAAAGRHAVDVTVTDPTGQRATAHATVDVTGAAGPLPPPAAPDPLVPPVVAPTPTPTPAPARPGVAAVLLTARPAKGRLRVGVTCTQVATCQGTVRLTATIGKRAVTLGSARFSVARGHAKVIAVTVGAAGRSALRRHPKGLAVAVRVLKASGRSWTNGKGVRVRPEKARAAR